MNNKGPKMALGKRIGQRFNAPYQFSFKDMLAIIFVAGFLYISWRALKDKDAIELVKTWMPILMTVLGGYFGTEVASAYFISKNPMNQNGMYNNYQYGSMYDNTGYNNNFNGNGGGDPAGAGTTQGNSTTNGDSLNP